MPPAAAEVNFDGIVGPTHHYGGLAYGNVASARHAGQVSRPREAARQGLAKMWALASAGLPQGVLPPHERPHVPTLRTLGFTGSDTEVVTAAASVDPRLLEAVSSASAMWVANAATVSPSPDTADGRVHLSVANLSSMLHRSIEAAQTVRILEATFPDRERFVVHPPLPAPLADEGAANHTRLAETYGAPGIEIFTYGRPGEREPSRFPARQDRRASEAVARRAGLEPDRTIFVQQHPAAIDAGVFHNDVIAVGNLDTLLVHEHAYVDTAGFLAGLRERFPAIRQLVVPASRISIEAAVRTYLFNSQLVVIGRDRVLVAPDDVRRDPAVWGYVLELIESEAPIDRVELFDLRQSMHNGGGPACLRLRVVVDPAELAAVNQATLLDASLQQRLETWIDRHYRDELWAADLADPGLLDEGRRALDELTGILDLGSVYDFQR